VLEEISCLIDRYAGSASFSGSNLHDLQVAVSEACTNAIVHGLHEDSSRTFELTVEADGDVVTVTLSEDGTPFDWGAVAPAERTSDLSSRKLGGLGIHLMFNLLDSVRFNVEPDGMKILVMTKIAKRSS
jgi:serine/threonine-protein kinase RsbW